MGVVRANSALSFKISIKFPNFIRQKYPVDKKDSGCVILENPYLGFSNLRSFSWNFQRKRHWRLSRIDMLNVASGEWVRDEFYNG